MSELLDNINETLAVIRKKTSDTYPVGIILGTGYHCRKPRCDFRYYDV